MSKLTFDSIFQLNLTKTKSLWNVNNDASRLVANMGKNDYDYVNWL